MVQKRVGIGWTFNFGNPWSLLVLLVVVGLIIAAALVPQVA